MLPCVEFDAGICGDQGMVKGCVEIEGDVATPIFEILWHAVGHKFPYGRYSVTKSIYFRL